MFALDKNNNIIHINAAKRKEDYYCGKCHGRLIVKDGSKRIKHFCHFGDDCQDRGESLTHRYWKEKISQKGEFKGFKIIKSDTEVSLLDGKYKPDIVLKTDKGEYIIVEICYTNPKTNEYLKFFKELKKLRKVYELKVEESYNEIREIRELYDRDEYFKEYNEWEKKLNLAKDYLIKNYSDNGGLKYEKDYFYITKNKGIITQKLKIYLYKTTEKYNEIIRTAPFEINVFSYNKLKDNQYIVGDLCKNTDSNTGLKVRVLNNYKPSNKKNTAQSKKRNSKEKLLRKSETEKRIREEIEEFQKYLLNKTKEGSLEQFLNVDLYPEFELTSKTSNRSEVKIRIIRETKKMSVISEPVFLQIYDAPRLRATPDNILGYMKYMVKATGKVEKFYLYALSDKYNVKIM